MSMPIAGARCRAGTAGVTALITGCATEPMSLQVRTEIDHPITPVASPVAFLHPQGFREHLENVTPYGGNYVLHLKVGEASDKALREVYPRLFVAPREVASREAFSQLADTQVPAGLLEPSIVALHYLNASRRMGGPCFAQIDYRFSLTVTEGETRTWIVRGFGEFDLDAEARLAREGRATLPSSEEGFLVEAPRRALEAGIANFARSFQRVPELIRFGRGAYSPADRIGNRAGCRRRRPPGTVCRPDERRRTRKTSDRVLGLEHSRSARDSDRRHRQRPRDADRIGLFSGAGKAGRGDADRAGHRPRRCSAIRRACANAESLKETLLTIFRWNGPST
jgi:hypothetical protein